MNLIVAVDNNWGIGYKGDLLARVSMDLKNFRKVTSGKQLYTALIHWQLSRVARCFLTEQI
jgi:hypothetical protein